MKIILFLMLSIVLISQADEQKNSKSSFAQYQNSKNKAKYLKQAKPDKLYSLFHFLCSEVKSEDAFLEHKLYYVLWDKHPKMHEKMVSEITPLLVKRDALGGFPKSHPIYFQRLRKAYIKKDPKAYLEQAHQLGMDYFIKATDEQLRGGAIDGVAIHLEPYIEKTLKAIAERPVEKENRKLIEQLIFAQSVTDIDRAIEYAKQYCGEDKPKAHRFGPSVNQGPEAIIKICQFYVVEKYKGNSNFNVQVPADFDYPKFAELWFEFAASLGNPKLGFYVPGGILRQWVNVDPDAALGFVLDLQEQKLDVSFLQMDDYLEHYLKHKGFSVLFSLLQQLKNENKISDKDYSDFIKDLFSQSNASTHINSLIQLDQEKDLGLRELVLEKVVNFSGGAAKDCLIAVMKSYPEDKRYVILSDKVDAVVGAARHKFEYTQMHHMRWPDILKELNFSEGQKKDFLQKLPKKE